MSLNDDERFAIEAALRRASDQHPGLLRGELVNRYLVLPWIDRFGEKKTAEMVAWVLRDVDPSAGIPSGEYLELISIVRQMLALFETHRDQRSSLSQEDIDLLALVEAHAALAEFAADFMKRDGG